MTRNVAQILGGALLIALVAAGTPLAQTLRIARTLATAEQKAETRLLLPGEWSGSKANASTSESKDVQGKTSPAAPQLVKPVSEQWDTVRPLQAPVADLPAAPAIPHCDAHRIHSNLSVRTWLPQTDPPDIRLRGPPTFS